MSSINEYFEQCALISLEKQAKFERLVGEHFAEFDLDAGILKIDNELALPFQVLGTQSDNTLTWLWAWSDEHAEVQPDQITAAIKLKEWGLQNGIEEFCIPEVDIERADGMMISLIAADVCKASCFYRDAYEGGAVFVLLSGAGIDRQPPFELSGFLRSFTDLASRYDLNHRNVVMSYLRRKGLPFQEDDTMITGKLASGEELRMEFGDRGGLLSLNGEFVPVE
jgi:hypothetical protein